MKIGVTYTYMGVEGTCWGYTKIEANSIKEARHKAIDENKNLENFKIQELQIVFEEEIKTNYLKNVLFEYQNNILNELDTMTCSSSKEFQAGYKMAVQDAKERIKHILK